MLADVTQLCKRTKHKSIHDTKKYNKHVNIVLFHIYKFEIRCVLNKNREISSFSN